MESASSTTMICNILNFLDASSMTLFEGPPSDRAERDRFYHENFRSLLSCVISPTESVRRLAIGVVKSLFANGQVLNTLRVSKGFDSPDFKTGFWRLTWVLPLPSPPRPFAILILSQISNPDLYV